MPHSVNTMKHINTYKPTYTAARIHTYTHSVKLDTELAFISNTISITIIAHTLLKYHHSNAPTFYCELTSFHTSLTHNLLSLPTSYTECEMNKSKFNFMPGGPLYDSHNLNSIFSGRNTFSPYILPKSEIASNWPNVKRELYENFTFDFTGS